MPLGTGAELFDGGILVVEDWLFFCRWLNKLWFPTRCGLIFLLLLHAVFDVLLDRRLRRCPAGFLERLLSPRINSIAHGSGETLCFGDSVTQSQSGRNAVDDRTDCVVHSFFGVSGADVLAHLSQFVFDPRRHRAAEVKADQLRFWKHGEDS